MIKKIKTLLTEEGETPVEGNITQRHARVTPAEMLARSQAALDALTPPKRVWKGWVAGLFASTPWLAVAIILFALFAQGAVATAALGYGLMKMALAVLATIVADATMFRGLKDTGTQPMTRRAMIFLGICWLLAVT